MPASIVLFWFINFWQFQNIHNGAEESSLHTKAHFLFYFTLLVINHQFLLIENVDLSLYSERSHLRILSRLCLILSSCVQLCFLVPKNNMCVSPFYFLAGRVLLKKFDLGKPSPFHHFRFIKGIGIYAIIHICMIFHHSSEALRHF